VKQPDGSTSIRNLQQKQRKVRFEGEVECFIKIFKQMQREITQLSQIVKGQLLED
jgi:hypothetical protein